MLASESHQSAPKRSETPRPKARAKARWKVAYDAEVAAMDNATLLEEVIENAVLSRVEWASDRYEVKRWMAVTELTRRLTAIGFLPPDDPARGM